MTKRKFLPREIKPEQQPRTKTFVLRLGSPIRDVHGFRSKYGCSMSQHSANVRVREVNRLIRMGKIHS
jgi:hypothetical protein